MAHDRAQGSRLRRSSRASPDEPSRSTAGFFSWDGRLVSVTRAVVNSLTAPLRRTAQLVRRSSRRWCRCGHPGHSHASGSGRHAWIVPRRSRPPRNASGGELRIPIHFIIRRVVLADQRQGWRLRDGLGAAIPVDLIIRGVILADGTALVAAAGRARGRDSN